MQPRQKYLMSFSDWVKARDARVVVRKECTSLQAVNHSVYTISKSRIALARSDTKRVWFSDGSSLPLGHKATREEAEDA